MTTCAERLPDQLAGRLADFRTMLDREDRYEAPDSIDEPGPIDEYAAGVTVRYAVRVDLSGGGPADYLDAIVDAGEVQSVVYHFADWFDHAERYLDGDELTTAAEYVGAVIDLDSIGEYVTR